MNLTNNFIGSLRAMLMLGCLLLGGQTLLATIRVVSTTPATLSCNGSIIVEATGTAGPFSLKISNGSGVVYEAPMAAPTATIEDLCVGNYTVEVFNAYGCAKTLSAEVSAGAGLLSMTDPQKQSEQQVLPSIWKAKAYPNPFNTDFQVELEWDRKNAEEIQVDILNALGQIVQTRRQAVVTGRNVFRIEMNDPASRGFLQVVLRDKNGRQVLLKVMQIRN